MNDFFKEIFDTARETAIIFLDKAERILRDVEKEKIFEDVDTTELEDLRLDNDQLAGKVNELEDLNSDLLAIVQILLDGEMRKDITMTWEKYYNLSDSTVSLSFTDSYTGEVTATITQER